MALYRERPDYHLEDGPSLMPSPDSKPHFSHHRKTRSLANDFLNEIGEYASMSAAEVTEIDLDKWNDKLVRRRQKSEADFTSHIPKMMQDENSGNGIFSTTFGKRVAQRPKATSRTTTSLNPDPGALTSIPIGLEGSSVADGFAGVRKSSSTPCFQDQESSSSSIWPTSMWNLKPDLQGFSTMGIARPFLDGLPKPVTGRRNKAAID